MAEKKIQRRIIHDTGTFYQIQIPGVINKVILEPRPALLCAVPEGFLAAETELCSYCTTGTLRPTTPQAFTAGGGKYLLSQG